MAESGIHIGMNGRFFPGNWRAARDEIVFAKMAGFDCIQFPGMLKGLDTNRLGDPLEVVGMALRRAGLTAVLEMVVPLYANGCTTEGDTPLTVLEANLQAIKSLQCTHVHWHFVLKENLADEQLRALEQQLASQLAEAVALARVHHFCFGLEHNSADVPLFHRPESCADVLTAVPDLGLVWDFNHTAEADFAAFSALADRVTMLHVSDTLWPDVNHHLPLGQGNLDLSWFLQRLAAAQFNGTAVLEIGGLPKSGGYGRDTNEALIESRARFEQMVQTYFT
jgi:L-ribulose-5-phosphate 3-epimerase